VPNLSPTNSPYLEMLVPSPVLLLPVPPMKKRLLARRAAP